MTGYSGLRTPDSPDIAKTTSKDFKIGSLKVQVEAFRKTRNRIPTVKLKIPGKAFLKSKTRSSVTFKL